MMKPKEPVTNKVRWFETPEFTMLISDRKYHAIQELCKSKDQEKRELEAEVERLKSGLELFGDLKAATDNTSEIATLKALLEKRTEAENQRLTKEVISEISNSRHNYCPSCNCRLDEIDGPCKWCKSRFVKEHAELQKTVAVMREALNNCLESINDSDSIWTFRDCVKPVIEKALSLSPSQLDEDLGKVRHNLEWMYQNTDVEDCVRCDEVQGYAEEALAILEKWIGR